MRVRLGRLHVLEYLVVTTCLVNTLYVALEVKKTINRGTFQVDQTPQVHWLNAISKLCVHYLTNIANMCVQYCAS